MEKHQRILIELIARQLFHTDYTPPADTDWEAVLLEARQQSVLLLAFEAATAGGLSAETAARWRPGAMRSFQVNANIFRCHRQVHELMQQNGIPYVVLKGCGSAFYYERPMLRAMGDVDILVRCEDMERVGAVLADAGYAKETGEHDFHISYRKGGAVVEVHKEITRFDDAVTTRDILKSYCEDFLTAAQLREIPDCGGMELMLPSVFHHGLSITLHTIRHLTDGFGIGLRHLCDLAVFYERFGDEEFTQLFEQRFRAAGLWRFTQMMGLLCREYLHIPYRKWMGEEKAEQIPEFILQDILNGGNFGRKNKGERYVQYLAMHGNTERKKTGKLARLCGFIQNCNEIGKKTFPVLDRPLLRRIIWIPYGVRYLCRCMTGKQEMFRWESVFSASEAREMLYRQLRLYKAEK